MARTGGRALTDLGGFRRQLVVLAGASAALVAAALALITQLVLSSATSQAVDRVLEDRVEAIVAATNSATTGTTLVVPDQGVDPGVVVYDDRGVAVSGSEPPSLRSSFAALAPTRGTTSREVEDAWRISATSFRTSSGATGVVVAAESLAPYEHDETQALVISLAAGVVIVLLTIAIATWISHRALAPVVQMARTAEEWSEHDLEQRFALGPPTDEIRALAHTLDGLLDKVGHAIRAEQRLTAELAHELRTPLTAIQGNAELMAMRDDLDPDVAEDLEAIRTATHTMSNTITVLLDLARQASTDGSCWSEELLTEAVRRHPSLTTVPAPEGVVVAVPLDVAMRAIAPVLDNAVRLASSVRLSVDPRPHHVDLVVRDDGPGVTDQTVLFVPGAQPGRSGLGLSLARRIARSVGGDVHFVSPDDDDQTRGATFVVRLPRA